MILVTTGERRTCSAELVSAIPAIEVLEISDGGSGRVYGTRQDLVATAPNSCLGVAGGCESLEGADCVLEDCGLCRCSMAVDAFSREVMWETRDEKWLDLVTTVGFEAFGQTFGYCVKGDTLELGTSETGVEHVFERVYRAGVPSACADREADRCVGPGCHWGECIGTGRCEGSESESDCLTRQDCEWDPNSCWGTGSEWCYADDYGRITGCELIDVEPICGGTALPCIDQNLVDFTDVSGCMASDDDVCVGGSHPCEDNFIEVPECVCDDDGLCEGTYSCETLSRFNCTSEYACEWRTNVPVGTPTPCEELEPETCTLTKGCFLTAP